MSAPAFPEADFYDCADSEELTWTEPYEAVEGFLDGFMSPKCDAAAVIQGLGELTVTAYERKPLDPAMAKRQAVRLVEDASDAWDDEYGGDNERGRLAGADIANAEAEVTVALATLYATGEPWQCEPCGEVVLSADQVEAWMREENPDWFEVSGA